MTDLDVQLKVTTSGAVDAARQVGGLGKSIDDLSPAADRSGEVGTKRFEQLRVKADSIRDAVKGVGLELGAFFALPAAGQLVGDLVRTSDAAKELEARIRLATRSEAEFNVVQTELFQIAQRTQQPVSALAELYARAGKNLGDLGFQTQDTLRFTEAIAQSFRISGASAAEADAATVQFAQGLAAGALRGDEFNSVIEQAPRLADALAAGLGVARGELRGLAEDGKLTSQAVASALLSQSEALQSEYSKLPLTIGGALTQVQNSVKALVAEIDSGTGASQVAIGLIQTLGENLEALATAAEIAAVGGIAAVARGLVAKSAALAEGIKASQAARLATIDEARAAESHAASLVREAQGQSIAQAARLEAAAATQRATQARLANAEAALLQVAADERLAVANLRAASTEAEKAAATNAAALAAERLAITEATIAELRATLSVATANLAVETNTLAAANVNATNAARGQAVAQQQLNAAQLAAAPAALTLKTALLDVNNALNLAFAAYVGFQIGSYLNEEFETARKAGVVLAGSLQAAFATLGVAWESFAALFTDDTIDQAIERYQARLRQLGADFDALYEGTEEAIDRTAEGAVRAADAVAGVAPALGRVEQVIKDVTGAAIELDERAGKAGKGLQSLGDDQLIAAISAVQSQLRTAADEVAVLEQQFNQVSDDALPAFEAANRDVFARANARVVELQQGVDQLRTEQFRRLGVDSEAVLTGIDAKARGLLDTFRSLSSDADTDVRLIEAAFKSLLKTLDSPAELEALKRSLAGVKAPAFDAATAVGEIEKKLVAVRLAADPAAKAITDAFAAFGIQTRQQLDLAARQAEENFRRVTSSGQATAVGLTAAFAQYARAQLEAGRPVIASTEAQRLVLEQVRAEYERKGNAAENAAARAIAANRAEADSLSQLGEAARRARMEKESLANAANRVTNLKDVSAAAASIDGRGAVGFGADGIERLAEIEQQIRQAIRAGRLASDALGDTRIESPADIAAARRQLRDAQGLAARLGGVTGSQAVEARTLSEELERGAAALERAVARFEREAVNNGGARTVNPGTTLGRDQIVFNPGGTASPQQPAPLPTPQPIQTIRVELVLGGQVIPGLFTQNDAQRLVDLLERSQLNAQGGG